ncbi:MAG: hypothetical protein M1499_07050 [Firmicutes bacterium]|nr:hypothetical protein [Bacillota bacterium]
MTSPSVAGRIVLPHNARPYPLKNLDGGVLGLLVPDMKSAAQRVVEAGPILLGETHIEGGVATIFRTQWTCIRNDA